MLSQRLWSAQILQAAPLSEAGFRQAPFRAAALRNGVNRTRRRFGRSIGSGVKAAERVGQCCHTAVAALERRPEEQQQQQPEPWWASLFRGSPYDGAIFSLALPAVLALAADPLLQIVDTIFVGQAGAEPLAALGVNSALFTFSFVVFNFLATATTPLVAAALAKGDSEKAGKVTMQALLLATVLGSVLAVGLVVGADGALALMGAGPETGEMHQLAKDFLLIRAAASPAVLVATVGQGVFRGLQDMRTPLGITLAANAINLALDTVLILGLHWGVTGAATATAAAEWTAAAAYLGLLWGRRDALGGLSASSVLGARGAQALQEFLPFLRAGGAVLMRTAMLLGTKTLASATAARLGAVPIASHQVVSSLWLLSSLVVDSVAIAGQTLVAVELGKGDTRAARAVSDRLLQLGVALGAVLAALFWAGEPVIPRIFSSDGEIEAAVRSILPLAVGMLPVNAAVYVLDGIFVGASDFKFLAGAMVVAAATAVGLLLGVEPLGLGLEGVWGAMALLMVSRLGTLAWRYQDPSGPLPPPQHLPPPPPAASAVEAPLLPAPVAPEAEEEVAAGLSRESSVNGEAAAPAAAVAAACIADVEGNGAPLEQQPVAQQPRPGAGRAAPRAQLANNAVLHSSPSSPSKQQQQQQKWSMSGSVSGSVSED